MSIFQVQSLLMAETGSYNDVVLRPYQPVVQQQQLYQMQEATRGGELITEQSIAGVAGQILRPIAQGVGIATCPNGWSTRRFRILIRVKLNNSFDKYNQRELVISGYTDYTGANVATQSIDPNMKLYFNSSVVLNIVPEFNGSSMVNRVRMAESTQILRGEFTPIVNRDNTITQSGDLAMRPEDVYQEMRSSMYTHHALINDASTFAGGIKKSYRENNDPTKYLSKVLNAYQGAVELDSTEQIQVLKKAQGMVREPTIAQDDFLYHLQRETQIMTAGCITWGELCHLNPHLESVTTINWLKPEALAQTLYTNASERWTGATPEVVAAQMIANAVPAMMLDHMMVKCAVIATNHTLGMGMDIKIVGYESYVQGMDITANVAAFKQDLAIFIERELTHNRQRSVNVQIQSNVMGDTDTVIGFNGVPPIRYVLPSFLDASIAPVVTNQRDTLKEMAMSISTLANNLSTSYGDNNGSYSSI